LLFLSHDLLSLKVLPSIKGADLRFGSSQPDTSQSCKTMHGYRGSAFHGMPCTTNFQPTAHNACHAKYAYFDAN